jgi:YfiH family protein
MVCLKQIHSSKILQITPADKGNGAEDYEESIAEADGMVTDHPMVPLVIFTADCVPVSLADPQNKVIGIAHAGWKGTEGKITEKTIKQMVNLGANKNNIVAGLGPAIMSCCYEVGQEFVDRFNDKYIETRNKKHYFDLIKMNEDILITSGIKKENIYRSDTCTKSNTDLCYSYRDSSQTGRMATVIMLWE